MKKEKLASVKEFKLFFNQVMRDREHSNLSVFNYDMAFKYLERFSGGGEIPMKSINQSWVQSFQKFLMTTSSFKNEKKLGIASARQYYYIITSVIRVGIDSSYIQANALKGCEFVKAVKPSIEPLSLEQLQELAQSECDSLPLKRAFIFSALTGLAWKDVSSLTWEQIEKEENGSMSIKLEESTRIVPLNQQAVKLLGEERHANEKVFTVKWNSYLYIYLNKWAIRAGIFTNIKFETARVTFAHMLQKQGVPIELISDLMGHKNIKSTLRITQEHVSSIS
jgi:integrase